MTIATTVTATELGSSQAQDPLPTIWRVPDVLWAEVKAILDQYDPPKRLGRKRIDQRKALDGIIFRTRSGCQWNQLPKEFGDDGSVHRTFQRWQRLCIVSEVTQSLDSVGMHYNATMVPHRAEKGQIGHLSTTDGLDPKL